MKHAFASLVLVFALAAGTSGCIIVADDADSSLTISNRSDYALIDIRVAPIDSTRWGSNLIGGDVLLPGEDITVFLRCDVYDVLVVDEDDFDCVLFGLDLCFSDAVWRIRNSTLDSCF